MYSSFGVKVIVPSTATLTVPSVVAITCAIPGVKSVPLIDTILKVSPSKSVSKSSGVNVTVPSSATV